MIEELLYFGNGNVAAFTNGKQLPREQVNCFIEDLKDKLKRGVVTPATKLQMTGWGTISTVKDLMGHLSEGPQS